MSINSVDFSMKNQAMQEGSASSKPVGGKEQMMAKLEASGITKEQVMQAKAKGSDAVNELFRGTGIQPPSQAKGVSSAHENQGIDRDKKMDLDSILMQLEEAGSDKEEYENAVENGDDAVKSLFEKYELSFNAIA